MTLTDLPLPSGVRRLVDFAIETVRSGVRRFRRGDANATAAEALTLLRRLTRLLRYTFVLSATWLPPVEPARVRTRATTSHTRRPTPSRRPAFQILPPYRVVIVDPDAPKRAQPAALACAERDPMRSAQRTLDALATALFDPMPRIRRIARKLRTALMVIGWRPPKRPPPTHRRDYWEELVDLRAEAVFALREWRRRAWAAA